MKKFNAEKLATMACTLYDHFPILKSADAYELVAYLSDTAFIMVFHNKSVNEDYIAITHEGRFFCADYFGSDKDLEKSSDLEKKTPLPADIACIMKQMWQEQNKKKTEKLNQSKFLFFPALDGKRCYICSEDFSHLFVTDNAPLEAFLDVYNPIPAFERLRDQLRREYGIKKNNEGGKK